MKLQPLLKTTGEKKDIYAQNKQNDEYKTAPGQFCWHEKSLYELFVHD